MAPIYAPETAYLSLEVMNRVDHVAWLPYLVLPHNLFLKNACNGNINQHNNSNNNNNNKLIIIIIIIIVIIAIIWLLGLNK